MRQTSPLPYPQQKELRHGVHYKSRDKQPSMFQILSWKQRYDAAENNDWLIKLKEGNKEGRFTEQQKYEKLHLTSFTDHTKKQTNGQHMHPHQIKHDLYYYGDEEAKKKKEAAVSPKPTKSPAKRQVKKLDRFNQEESRQIESRKKNIQKFNAFTRELPNSAFTTYFGKPAFEHYGFGTESRSIANLKSHSVMPHAGKNSPEVVQSHAGALKKANVINLQTHVPKMRMEGPPNDCKVNIKQYYNVQIVKPDLINEVRFANEDRDLKFRSKTPRHDDLNHLPKRQYKSPPVESKKKPKAKKKTVNNEDRSPKLAFMDNRQHFMKQVNEKRKMQNRLAYKVTECHPYNWDYDTEAASTAKQQKWKQIRPAGISSSKSLNARQFVSF